MHDFLGKLPVIIGTKVVDIRFRGTIWVVDHSARRELIARVYPSYPLPGIEQPAAGCLQFLLFLLELLLLLIQLGL